MSTITAILVYLIQSLSGLYLFAVLLRLLLQLVRADFYNPLSQFLVKVTNPLVRPLRRAIPPIGRIDSASLVLALGVQALTLVLVLALARASLPNPAVLLAWSVIGVLVQLLNLYFFALIAMIVLSWVAPYSTQPAALLLRQLIAPVMEPLRKVLPPLGPIDFSPILAFIAIKVGYMLLGGVAGGLGLPIGVIWGL